LSQHAPQKPTTLKSDAGLPPLLELIFADSACPQRIKHSGDLVFGIVQFRQQFLVIGFWFPPGLRHYASPPTTIMA